LKDNVVNDTLQAKSFPKQVLMKKSPTTAVLLSLACPGLGQLYVESYWKAPLFFGAAATLTGMIIWYNSKFLDERDAADKIVDKTSTEYLQLKASREFYRDNRDQSALFLLGVYVLAAVDAYTGAHLFDFNVDENLSLNFYPDSRRGMVVGVGFKLF